MSGQPPRCDSFELKSFNFFYLSFYPRPVTNELRHTQVCEFYRRANLSSWRSGGLSLNSEELKRVGVPDHLCDPVALGLAAFSGKRA